MRKGAERCQGRSHQAFANMTHAPGPAGAGIFFMEDHLLADAQTTPAILGFPAHTYPATGGQFAFPRLAFGGEAVLVARAASKAQGCERSLQMARQPAGDFLAKRFVRTAESNLHACSPNNCAARRSRCQAGVPSNCSLALARLK
ncbi:hypothetical protein D3C76_1402220 [compost metagenome]